ncbi:YciK family oxidoreductase [bacterium endosymbiont of Bathymodiolus sp. 5 South]|jgi:NAD(P)-dependent dehydrogenase (short-subunit alcohol dehydrogenase family)|uniref:YciK family oxidoreductase n=1 Tax=bacterium endosymbiont of Bathymodiolus sp. 5 South TaxID=1181670 RepID=UPI0010B416CE|nr:YciK family oxidoreductase [bacterium endosymbiont of Bathymodiolus sp. 5 South]VVH57930.1 Oxidoreductase, short-chain dehydrogenase/reductase family [uncultured Gammaproteobacteria bacterium]SHN90925.1 Oxidoreductase, short-chain dehydrogenase/reductase family [bacterium endosymbiont of Bathymodiolus sp. 5 South]SSC07436.1 Short-chain dehydrogenase/reductase SDR [bacterium endosymbiont of Bathymodiolus sp. 5 South]VVH62545.1 Oxidoreductase, short-chain dehydrogenase/reductase family [uncult
MNIKTNYQITKDELKDKTILVTGANRGFGRAMTLDLAKAGASVIMLGRDLGSLEGVYDEVVDAKYQEPILYPFDLEGATPEHYEQLQKSILDNFGHLDGLIHNASIIGTMMPIEQYDIKLWYSTMQINLNAPFMLTQFLIPALNQSDDARVLFLSSSVGRSARAYWGAYGVSKFAIEGLSKTLSEELEKTNIKVNSLDPGRMKTEMRRAAYPAENADKNPLPEDKSPAIVYLMSEKSNKLNGEQITLSNA